MAPPVLTVTGTAVALLAAGAGTVTSHTLSEGHETGASVLPNRTVMMPSGLNRRLPLRATLSPATPDEGDTAWSNGPVPASGEPGTGTAGGLVVVDAGGAEVVEEALTVVEEVLTVVEEVPTVVEEALTVVAPAVGGEEGLDARGAGEAPGEVTAAERPAASVCGVCDVCGRPDDARRLEGSTTATSRVTTAATVTVAPAHGMLRLSLPYPGARAEWRWRRAEPVPRRPLLPYRSAPGSPAERSPSAVSPAGDQSSKKKDRAGTAGSETGTAGSDTEPWWGG